MLCKSQMSWHFNNFKPRHSLNIVQSKYSLLLAYIKLYHSHTKKKRHNITARKFKVQRCALLSQSRANQIRVYVFLLIDINIYVYIESARILRAYKYCAAKFAVCRFLLAGHIHRFVKNLLSCRATINAISYGEIMLTFACVLRKLCGTECIHIGQQWNIIEKIWSFKVFSLGILMLLFLTTLYKTHPQPFITQSVEAQHKS